MQTPLDESMAGNGTESEWESVQVGRREGVPDPVFDRRHLCICLAMSIIPLFLLCPVSLSMHRFRAWEGGVLSTPFDRISVLVRMICVVGTNSIHPSLYIIKIGEPAHVNYSQFCNLKSPYPLYLRNHVNVQRPEHMICNGVWHFHLQSVFEVSVL
jgi:hypothetical protein